MAKQHKIVVWKTEIQTKGRQRQVRLQKTRWKLKGAEQSVKRVNKELEQQVQKTWDMLSMTLKKAADMVLGKLSGKAGKKEETWWWNVEVQEVVARKREKKKEQDRDRCEETIITYKQANKEAKRAVAKAKATAFNDLYASLEEKEGQQRAIRIARQKNTESQDIYQAKQ